MLIGHSWSPSLGGITLLSVVVCLWGVGTADEINHVYNDMEPVVVWTDKAFPMNNPQETYPYSAVPLCELFGAEGEPVGGGNRRQSPWISDLLEGHTFVRSPKVVLNFGIAAEDKKVCSMTLSSEQAQTLKRMVLEDYSSVFYVDDLPASLPIGVVRLPVADETPENADAFAGVPMVYTHRNFEFQMNGNRIISIDIEPGLPVPIAEGVNLALTYSVNWVETNLPFNDRFNRYVQQTRFERQIHWLSVINSFVLCLFLCAVVVIILSRTLKNDFAKYAASEAAELESLDRADESGWKQVHGDVFRRPNNLLILSVVVGSGSQLGFVTFLVGVLSVFNSYFAQKGITVSSIILPYAFTQIVNGFAGGYIFRLYGGKSWQRAMVVQLFSVPFLAFLLFSVTWVVATSYQSSQAIPLFTLFGLVGLFIFVCLPLHLVGTRFGRNRAANVSFPCRVHQLKRPIPPKPRSFFPTMIASAGIVPFGCVFIETYFLFQSIWSFYKFYYIYGFIVIILLLLCLVLVCVSITCTYTLLHAEDYRWAWTSVHSCAATAVYVFLYAIFYYRSSRMTGLLQSVHYFTTTLFFSVCLALFCGAVGHIGAFQFVSIIYRNIKSD